MVWVNLAQVHVVGDDFKPLPNKLVITWFSYIENKFYTGEFDLPYDKIKQLFDEGLDVYSKWKTYNIWIYIMVGLGLNGEIFRLFEWRRSDSGSGTFPGKRNRYGLDSIC